MTSKLCLLVFAAIFQSIVAQELPNDFAYVTAKIPKVKLDIRYYSGNNFTGGQVAGYQAPKAILTKQALCHLAEAQEDFLAKGYALKIFDAYRPQRAVNHFVRWARDLDDTLKKAWYYPNVAKSQLFQKGYIAAKSGHSRGSTVDVTLVGLKNQCEIDMGTPFDFFSRKSWPSSRVVTERQRQNRLLLQKVMEKHGFKPLKTEWWHFTLRDEPYPNTYFDFVVK